MRGVQAVRILLDSRRTPSFAIPRYAPHSDGTTIDGARIAAAQIYHRLLALTY